METSDPERWFQFSSLRSVFTDRQVLRFRFNNEEKFLPGLCLLVLAAMGLATDGWLELITRNGENIMWPHWVSPRGGCASLQTQAEGRFPQLGTGQKPWKETSLLNLKVKVKTRNSIRMLRTLGSLVSTKRSDQKPRVKARPRDTSPQSNRIALQGSYQLHGWHTPHASPGKNNTKTSP